jgi:hypothetical protein
VAALCTAARSSTKSRSRPTKARGDHRLPLTNRSVANLADQQSRPYFHAAHCVRE